MIKRALIWDPYLDTLGGGERYALTVAKCLIDAGAEVVLPWNNPMILEEAGSRFGLKLNGVEISDPLYYLMVKGGSLLKRKHIQSQFDLIFWVSDGSLPFLFAKKNFLHFQVPFRHLGGNNITNQLKLLTIDRLVYNSQFTQNVIEQSLPSGKGVVLYPPVTASAKQGKKAKIILNVGRFVSPSHAKRQDVLIDAFRKLVARYPKASRGWKLILAGGHRGGPLLLKELHQMAKGLPIEFVVNPEFTKLQQLYQKSSIYWHAAGYGIDETQEPEKVEHFGITTVEAMAAGIVPVVINKGGQKEIVAPDSGYLVNDINGLVDSTVKTIRDKRTRSIMANSALARSEKFTGSVFCANLMALINE